MSLELASHFARPLSEWDSGWKQLGDYAEHGGASEGDGLKYQGNGEEHGRVEKEEKTKGEELAEAGRLKGAKEGRGKLGEETSGVKIAGVGGKIGCPEAEGARGIRWERRSFVWKQTASECELQGQQRWNRLTLGTNIRRKSYNSMTSQESQHLIMSGILAKEQQQPAMRRKE